MKNKILFQNLSIVFIILIAYEKSNILIDFSSEIKLVIKGTGKKNIIYNSFNFEPSEVKIEGISNNCKKICTFKKDLNNVVLYYSNSINTCENMFYLLPNIIEIDFSKFDFSKVKSTKNMFYNCTQLKKINFGNIKTTSLTNMESMFSGCTNLISIDLSKFTTNKIKSFSCVFMDCKSLVTINLGNLDTSSATTLKSFFEHCEKIEYIDISSFKTSLVTNMFHVFFHCYCLKVISFPDILDISKITTMDAMFSHCWSLVALNMTIFHLNKDADIGYLFHNCNKLKYLDLSSFSTNPISKMCLSFRNLSSLIYLNIPNLEITTNSNTDSAFQYLSSFQNLKICSKKTKMKSFISAEGLNNKCDDQCFKPNMKIGYNKNTCITSCKGQGYNYEYLNICYNNCPKYTHAIHSNNNKALICLDKKPEGYYLDTDEFYKKCYESCKLCDKKGSELEHNCIICKKDYYSFDDSFYKNNCYQKCQYYYYYDNKHKYHCIDSCSTIHYKLIVNTNKCINNCEKDSKFKYEYNKICYEECYKGINSEKEGICFDKNIFQYINTTNMEIIGKNEEIYQRIIDKGLPNYDISKGEEMIIKGKENFYFSVTNSKNDLELLNEKNTNSNKFSVIDLGKCEELLKNYYHINKNTLLLIIKFEKITNISSERTFQYEIYNPNTKLKLNLSICSNTTIDIYTPVILSEKLQNLYEELKNMGYDLFDINNPFYQDICTSYTSSDETDVPLLDRINNYYNNNETVCQSNCKFSNYLMKSQHMKCQCDTMNSEIDIQKPSKLNPKLIYKSFYSVLKYSNYKVLFCYKLAFSINSVTINFGSIITIVLFLIFTIFVIIYIAKGKNQINLNIKEAYKKNLEKNNTMKIQKNNNNKNQIFNKNGALNDKVKKFNNFNNNLINNRNDNLVIRKIKDKKIFQRFNHKLPQNKIIQKLNNKEFISNKIINKFNNKVVFVNRKGKNNNYNSEFEKIKGNNNINRKILKINQTYSKQNKVFDYCELNNLEYFDAKKYDKRTFCPIYWSLLKREHPFIFTFITKDDYNITMAKYSRFIFLLCTDMAMNVFFFSDETMHKMFLDYGKYNFIQQIPQILYSTILSKLLELLLCFLSMTDHYYYQIKNSKKINKNLFLHLTKCIKIKIGFFFGLTIFLFAFYWYFICCFCAVYKNTQIAFLKDSFSSFLLDNLIPFLIYLFPSLLRIVSLKTNKKFVYKLSNIIPFF